MATLKLQRCVELGTWTGRTIYDYNEEGSPYDGYNYIHRDDVGWIVGSTLKMPPFVTHKELDEIMNTLPEEKAGKLHHFSQWWIEKTEKREHKCHCGNT